MVVRRLKFYKIATIYICSILTVIALLLMRGLGWI